jgi:hypothetical protein
LDNFVGELDKCCAKRFLKIFNPVNGKHEYLVFCNEWLKLKAQEKEHSEDNYILYELSRRNFALEIIDELVFKHIGLNPIRRSNQKSYFDHCSITVCDRPFIAVNIHIETAFEIYHSTRRIEILNAINHVISRWINRNERFKKYKSSCEQITRILKNIRHYRQPEEREVILNDLLLLIIKIQTS